MKENLYFDKPIIIKAISAYQQFEAIKKFNKAMDEFNNMIIQSVALRKDVYDNFKLRNDVK